MTVSNFSALCGGQAFTDPLGSLKIRTVLKDFTVGAIRSR